LNQKSNKHI